MISFFIGAVIIFTKIVSPSTIAVQGWSSLALLVLFFGGMLMFMCGLMLEYVSVLLLHTQGKPSYFVVAHAPDPVRSNVAQVSA